MADDLNETYYRDYPEFQISYTPTFTWNKGKKRGGTAVTKIGIRATNALCSASTKSKEEAKENFCGHFKEDILQQYGFNLHKDVKSSVPRLTLSINSNGWVSEDIDIYEMIYKELVKTVDGGGYPFSQIREVIKTLHMRAYFDSPGKLGVHTRRAMKNKMDISAVSNVMRIFQDAVLTVEGNIPFDNEIFFHESNIYLAVTAYLLDDGFFVWQVYDSWYAKMDGVSQSDFEEYVTDIVAGIANQYIENYYHGYEY